jgi:RHS repeat-associated protein
LIEARRIFFLFCLFAIHSFLGNAQNGNPAQLTDPHGDQPFGSYQVSDIDQIGFANGSLDVRIPLFVRHGRGLAHEKYFHFTNKNWYPDSGPSCDSSVMQCPPPVTPTWAFADNNLQFSYTTQYPSPCGRGGFGSASEYTDFTYIDDAGTPHKFDVVVSRLTPAPTCIHQKLKGYAIDGSGMMIDVTDYLHPIVTLKDGTRIQDDQHGIPSFLHQDTNGNMITVDGVVSTGAVNGEFDTLGRDVRTVITTGLPNNGSYEDWITKDQNGNDQVTRIEWSYAQVSTNFQQTGIQETAPSIRFAQKIDLPNGLSYRFTYDTGSSPGHYGELLRIDLPAGGYVRYEYAPISTASSVYSSIRSVTKRAVSVDGNPANEKAWTYSYQLSSPSAGFNTTTVADPDGNQTVHVTLDALFASGNFAPLEVQTKYYQGTAASGRLLKTVSTDYNTISFLVGDGDSTVSTRYMNRPIRVTTMLDNGLVSKVETDYDSLPDNNGEISYSRSNVTERREYDFGQGAPGPLLRRTTYTYQHNANSAYATANIVDKVLNTTVYDSAGNIVAQTQNGYDETPLTATSGAPNHDYTGFGTGNTTRGNLTSAKHWRNTDNTWLPMAYSYDDLGNIISTTDPGGHTTNYSFSDSWSGASCTPTGMNTYAFLTQITNSLSQRTQASYYSCPGLIQSKRDENDIRASRTGTTFTYDSINRLLTATAPDGGSTNFNYHGDALPLTITKTEIATPDPSIVSSVIYDGLGRVQTTSLDSDPLGADIVDTTYDNLGRKLTVSNPHRATAASTDGITTYQYDALGRVIQVAPPDGTVPTPGSTCQANNVCTSYSGNSVTSTDQAGKQRRSFSDALGRLIEVDEPGDNFAGATASGSLPMNGTLQSVSGIGAQAGQAATGSVNLSGVEQHINDPNGTCTRSGCPQIYDSGLVTITINGVASTADYGQNSNTTTLASALADAINRSGASAYVSASGSGAVVSLTAKNVGSAGNSISVSFSASTDDSFDFPAGSFSGSVTAMHGGMNANPGTTVYDSGTVTLTIGSFQATATYGQSGNSTAALVASALAGSGPTGLSRAGSPVTASAPGSSIIISAASVGVAGNLSVVCSSSTSQTAYFSSPSFTCPGVTLSGGQDPSGPSLDHNFFVTQYTYDTLGNLTQVTQKGDPAVNPSSQWRIRNFTYNSLSRLLTASNPESGTISYTYDADGNLLQKASPVPNQTNAAVTQTVSHAYDALHRVTSTAYSDGTVVGYVYDQTGVWGPNETNTVGRLVLENTGKAARLFSYDSMGRPTTTWDCTPKNMIDQTGCYTVQAQYDLAGDTTSITYPSGYTVTYTPDAAGRMISAVDNLRGSSYATAATYAADGQLAAFISGKTTSFAGITNSISYNQRLQPVTMSASSPSQTVFSIGYDFHVGNGNNGNVWNLYNYKDHTRDQSFTYDALNRLTSAQNAGTNCATTTVNGKTEYWGNSYTYDAWGNLIAKSVTKCSAENLSVVALTNNQLSGYSYDAAGNMLNDGQGHTFTYDAENRISALGGNAATYTYDPDGSRVRKDMGANFTEYIYYGGNPIAERDQAGYWTEYIFFAGQRIARRDASGAVSYYFSDHLHTASVITDASGTIKSESDYYPWGGELQFANSDSNHYKFTGKERDSETGLDYFGARYYSNGLGRFLTPDWAAKATAVPYAEFADPQSLNLYGYVRNLPTVRWDADGHQSCGKGATSVCSEIPKNTLGVPADTNNKLTTNSDGNIVCSGNCPNAAAITDMANTTNNLAEPSTTVNLGNTQVTIKQDGTGVGADVNAQAIPSAGATLDVTVPKPDPSKGTTTSVGVGTKIIGVAGNFQDGKLTSVTVSVGYNTAPGKVDEINKAGLNVSTSPEHTAGLLQRLGNSISAFYHSGSQSFTVDPNNDSD